MTEPKKKRNLKTKSDIFQPPKGDKTTRRKAVKQTVLEYMDKGLSAEEAYCIANPGHTPTARLLQLYRKEHQHITLSHPVLVAKAQDAIAETLDGHTIVTEQGETITPTYSNRLQAAQMVLDRAEPIIKVSHNLNVNASVPIVDLSKYLNIPQPPVSQEK